MLSNFVKLILQYVFKFGLIIPLGGVKTGKTFLVNIDHVNFLFAALNLRQFGHSRILNQRLLLLSLRKLGKVRLGIPSATGRDCIISKYQDIPDGFPHNSKNIIGYATGNYSEYEKKLYNRRAKGSHCCFGLQYPIREVATASVRKLNAPYLLIGTQSTAGSFAEIWGNCYFVGNAVHLERIPLITQAERFSNETGTLNTITLLMVTSGNFVHRGVELACEAVRKLNANGVREYKINIVGDYKSYSKDADFKEKYASESIIFHGFLDLYGEDFTKLVRQSDLGVCLSCAEGISGSAAIMFCYGLPLILSTNTGVLLKSKAVRYIDEEDYALMFDRLEELIKEAHFHDIFQEDDFKERIKFSVAEVQKSYDNALMKAIHDNN